LSESENQMNSQTAPRQLAVLLSLALGLAGCAASRPPEGSVQQAVWENEAREEVEDLKRAMEASYDRERALAERLRHTEEANIELLQEMQRLRETGVATRAYIDSLQSAALPGPAPRAAGPGADMDVADAYSAALAQYRNRQYQSALDQFSEILSRAPYSEYADNAQYWKGECYYGLGKYRDALTEFTKVFAFEKTEKTDHAQFKIARCYMAMGEKDKALGAFQKLLDEYPESDMVDRTRKEMSYLQGP